MGSMMFDDLVARKQPREIHSKCKCCGSSFEVELYIEQDFCNRCYPIIVRELFNPENGKLTCKEFIKKMKAKVKEE